MQKYFKNKNILDIQNKLINVKKSKTYNPFNRKYIYLF
jgi:hypothetical protein